MNTKELQQLRDTLDKRYGHVKFPEDDYVRIIDLIVLLDILLDDDSSQSQELPKGEKRHCHNCFPVE